MAIFDEILNDVDQRFDLNGKAPALLSNLLTVVTDAQNNSLIGFLELFHRAGLGHVAETWINSGANTPLSRQQLADALGDGTLTQIASRSDLSKDLTTSALAYMTPLVVDQLTPNGIVPDGRALAASVSQYLQGEQRTAATGAAVAAQNVVSSTSSGNMIAASDNFDLTTNQNNRGGNSLLRLLLPLMLVGLLAFLSFRFCTTPNQQLVFPNVNKTVGSNVNTNNNSTTKVETH